MPVLLISWRVGTILAIQIIPVAIILAKEDRERPV